MSGPSAKEEGPGDARANAPPPLGALVRAGESQTEAVRLNDFVFMSQDISNSYLVTTRGDNVLINAGMATSGPRHKRLYDAISQAPIAYAILSQSHPDHFGSLAALASQTTETICHRNFVRNETDRARLGGFFQPRVAKLWGPVIGTVKRVGLDFEPDIMVDDNFAFTVGDRRFEVLATPGGETTDSLCVWLPDDRIVFTGNLFGPIFRHVPNLYTIRGERIRSALEYVRSLDRVAALGADMLITGHGDPVVGAEQITRDLARMRAATLYVHDATIAGMNAGKDVQTLMREIQLPSKLSLGEGHGKTSWNVRAIWEEYAGWFHYDSTTTLYDVPRSSIHADLIELGGGVESFAERAQHYIAQARPLEALHLTDIALNRVPDDRACLRAKRAAITLLLERSRNENLSETMWLRSELTAADALLQQR